MDDNHIVSKLKQLGLKYFNDNFELYYKEFEEFYCICSFLDPRTKDLIFLT